MVVIKNNPTKYATTVTTTHRKTGALLVRTVKRLKKVKATKVIPT